jgi:RIO-like serine/threonine protein kinase
MSLYLLIKLAIDTGYTHGDFHQGNIMINKSYKKYFKDINGSPLIIDFGYAKKINDEDLILIKEYFIEKNYDKILRMLCTIGRSNNLNMIHSEYSKYYGWVYGNYDYFRKVTIIMNEKGKNKLNIELNELNERREIEKEELIKYFEEMHYVSPNDYPLLPINNSIKNRMFIGLNI